MVNKMNTVTDNHMEILKDICMTLHNCADCYDDSTTQACCNPQIEMEIFNLTECSFCIECYDSDTNRRLFDIGKQREYEVERNDKESLMEYMKR